MSEQLRGCDTTLEDTVRLLVGSLARSASTSDILKVADKLKYEPKQKKRISVLLHEIAHSLEDPAYVPSVVDNVNYKVSEYDCGDESTIKLVPALVQHDGIKPEYWCITRVLHAWDNKDLWKAGYKYLYWTARGWWHHTPIQFATALDAMQCHKGMIDKKEEDD